VELAHADRLWRVVSRGFDHGTPDVDITRVYIGQLVVNGDLCNWCERGDSNPHALRRSILSRLRLPFRHSRNGTHHTDFLDADN
jgi:hypothetical protein